MPAEKVRVEVTQGSGFRTECKAGKHTLIIDQPTPSDGTDVGPTPLDVQLKKRFLHDIDARCPISESLQNATPVKVFLFRERTTRMIGSRYE